MTRGLAGFSQKLIKFASSWAYSDSLRDRLLACGRRCSKDATDDTAQRPTRPHTSPHVPTLTQTTRACPHRSWEGFTLLRRPCASLPPYRPTPACPPAHARHLHALRGWPGPPLLPRPRAGSDGPAPGVPIEALVTRPASAPVAPPRRPHSSALAPRIN